MLQESSSLTLQLVKQESSSLMVQLVNDDLVVYWVLLLHRCSSITCAKIENIVTPFGSFTLSTHCIIVHLFMEANKVGTKQHLYKGKHKQTKQKN